MTAQRGRDFLLKIYDESSSGYKTVGGMRSNSFSLNDAPVEITNKSSGDFAEYMENGGVRSLTIGGSGIFVDDAEFRKVHDHMMAGTHADCQIIIPDFMTYTGKFAVKNLELTGEYNGEVSYNISLASSGAITTELV